MASRGRGRGNAGYRRAAAASARKAKKAISDKDAAEVAPPKAREAFTIPSDVRRLVERLTPETQRLVLERGFALAREISAELRLETSFNEKFHASVKRRKDLNKELVKLHEDAAAGQELLPLGDGERVERDGVDDGESEEEGVTPPVPDASAQLPLPEAKELFAQPSDGRVATLKQGKKGWTGRVDGKPIAVDQTLEDARRLVEEHLGVVVTWTTTRSD